MGESGKWRLRLLGGFALSAKESTVEISLGRNERALLAYLLLHPHRRQTRDKLATLLWGNIAESSAHQSLRECLSKLRKVHDDHDRQVFSNQGDYIVVDAASFDVDVDELMLLAKGNDRDSLERAVALHSGDLLDGLDVRSQDFEEWLRTERARIENAFSEASIRLMDLQASAGEADQAAATAHGILGRDPECEEAHRLLMRQHWTAKRWRAAFEQYQACEKTLKATHGIPPSPETRQLLEEIKSAHQHTGNHTVVPPIQPEIAVPPKGQKSIQVSHGLAHGRHSVRRLIRSLVTAIASLVLVLVAVITVMVIQWWRVPELAPAPFGDLVWLIKGPISPTPPSIVVLPFKGSGDNAAEASEYASAVAEGINTALAKASEMFVIAQSSADNYKQKNLPLSQIASELGVRYVLEGSLQKWGDRVTIQIALVDTKQGEHIQMSESFEGKASDFYNLQRSITLEIITSLQVEITEGEKERINLAHGTRNLDAWLLAAEAYKLLRHLSFEDNLRARDLYERAIQLDPRYAGAQEGLAWTYFIEVRFGWSQSPQESLAKAIDLAQVVQTLDPTRARVHSLLGGIELLNRSYDAAIEYGEKAVDLEPNDADAAFLLGYTLTFAGKPQQAIGLVERAIERTPFAPGLYYLVLGRANRLTGNHEKAAVILETLVAADPASYIPYVELAATYAELGKTNKARAAAEKVLQINPSFRIGIWVSFPAFEDDATTTHEVEILRVAGLPE